MQSRGSHPSLRMINVCCPTLGMNSIKQQAEDIEIDVQADDSNCRSIAPFRSASF